MYLGKDILLFTKNMETWPDCHIMKILAYVINNAYDMSMILFWIFSHVADVLWCQKWDLGIFEHMEAIVNCKHVRMFLRMLQETMEM